MSLCILKWVCRGAYCDWLPVWLVGVGQDYASLLAAQPVNLYRPTSICPLFQFLAVWFHYDPSADPVIPISTLRNNAYNFDGSYWGFIGLMCSYFQSEVILVYLLVCFDWTQDTKGNDYTFRGCNSVRNSYTTIKGKNSQPWSKCPPFRVNLFFFFDGAWIAWKQTLSLKSCISFKLLKSWASKA